MATRHVIWDTKELSKVASVYLDILARNPGAKAPQILLEAQKVLPESRWHPGTWIYPARNKKLLEQAMARVKVNRANAARKGVGPPPPPAAQPVDRPTVASPPPVTDPGAVSATQAGGDLGATFEALFERLGEAFGRGFSRTSGTLDIRVVPVNPVPVIASDPAEARANAAEREALQEQVGLPRKPKVLVLGGMGPDHADLRKEVGVEVDLRCVSASRRKVKHALAAWNGSPIIAWTRYCSHGLVQSAKYHSPQSVHYVAGQLGDVVAKIKEVTGG